MYIWRKYTPRLCEKLSAVSYRSNLHKRWERHPNMEDRPLRYGFLHDVKSGYLTVTLPPKYYMLHSGRSPEDLVKHPLTHSLITRSKGEFTKRNSLQIILLPPLLTLSQLREKQRLISSSDLNLWSQKMGERRQSKPIKIIYRCNKSRYGCSYGK